MLKLSPLLIGMGKKKILDLLVAKHLAPDASCFEAQKLLPVTRTQ
jgi:hypothetical protein